MIAIALYSTSALKHFKSPSPSSKLNFSFNFNNYYYYYCILTPGGRRPQLHEEYHGALG